MTALSLLVLVTLSLLLLPLCSSGLSISKPFRTFFGKADRQEIDIHRVRSLDYVYYSGDDSESAIENDEVRPESEYYLGKAKLDTPRNCRIFHYVATLKNHKTIIGSIEVDPNYEGLDYEILRGILLVRVETDEKFRRMGVASALYNAIEDDARVLYDSMHIFHHDSKHIHHQHKAIKERTDGKMEIRLFSFRERPALQFYRKMGFRFDTSEEDCEVPSMGRLEWSWECLKSLVGKESLDLIKLLKVVDTEIKGSVNDVIENSASKPNRGIVVRRIKSSIFHLPGVDGLLSSIDNPKMNKHNNVLQKH